MLEVVRKSVSDRTKAAKVSLHHSLFVGSRTSTTFDTIAIQEISPIDVIERRRSAADFLQQGSRLYGRDRAVENFQLNGRISLLPKEIGRHTLTDPNGSAQEKGWHTTGSIALYKDRGGTYTYLAFPSDFYMLSFGSSKGAVNTRVEILGAVSKTWLGRTFVIPIQVYLSMGPYKSTILNPLEGWVDVMPTSEWSYDVDSSYGRPGSRADSNWGHTIYVNSRTWLRDRLLARFPATQHAPSRSDLCKEMERLATQLFWMAASAIDLTSIQSSYFAREYKQIKSHLGTVGTYGSVINTDALSHMYSQLARTETFSGEELSLLASSVIEKYNDFSSNLLAYVSDMGKAGDTLRTLIRLPRDVKNPKAWASAWLSGRYGDRLAVSDTQELLKAVSAAISRGGGAVPARARTSHSVNWGSLVGQATYTASLFVADDSFSGVGTAINNLMRWDAWPTLENTWDLVPLSFVVDWVLPVQDILDQIDKAVQSPYLKVIGAYTSISLEVQGCHVAEGVVMDLAVKYYRRFGHNILNDLKPFTVRDYLPSFGVTHAGDALALLVQFRR